MVHIVRHLSQRASRAVEDAHRINLSEMTLLGNLRKSGGSVRMVDLSARLHVTRAAITKIADSLERSGLVERGLDEDDRRVVRLGLTAAGQEKLAGAERTFESYMKANLWDHLSDSETESMAVLLRKVEGNLHRPERG